MIRSNKKLLQAVMVVATFFFVCLGMRNPYLQDDPAPKPRPRAVLKSFSTSTQQLVKQIEAVVVTVAFIAPVISAEVFVKTAPVFTGHASVFSTIPSRAPPLMLA